MVVARAPIGVAGPVTARLTAKSQPIVLRLRGGATLAVTVVGTDGKPIETANVELRGNDFQTTTTVHGNASFAPVVPGNYELIAWADGTARTTQRMRVAGNAKVRLMLASGAAVSGRVVDEGGAGIANARVVYIGSSGFRGQVDPRRDSVITLKDGTFKFPALAAGSVRFLARHDEHSSGMSSLVTLDGKTEKKRRDGHVAEAGADECAVASSTPTISRCRGSARRDLRRVARRVDEVVVVVAAVALETWRHRRCLSRRVRRTPTRAASSRSRVCRAAS